MAKQKRQAPNPKMTDEQEKTEISRQANPVIVEELEKGGDVTPTVDLTGPKQGDRKDLPNGDYEIFSNGVWIYHISPPRYTGQEPL